MYPAADLSPAAAPAADCAPADAGCTAAWAPLRSEAVADLDAALVREAWPWVRVAVPDHPEAIATSATGSLLAGPPRDGAPYRREAIAEIDGPMPPPGDRSRAEATGPWAPQELFDALGVAPYHARGFRGQGVKVAVFDIQFQGWERALPELGAVQTHDCYRHRSCGPAIDGLRPRYSFEFGGHGVACAEVLRDIAPEAELHLVQVSGGVTLENAVDWAIRNEIDLVSMSLSYFGESFSDGTGPVNAQMSRLAAAGVLLVTSAGNYAAEHHADTFRDTDGDGRHERPDGEETLQVEWSAGTRRLQLSWDQFGRCETDLDVYVYNAQGRLVGRGVERQDPDDRGCQAVERVAVDAREEGIYDVVIHRRSGPMPGDFELYARSGRALQWVPFGSIADPGSHPAVLTVGAVNTTDYLLNGAESFSSWGPTRNGLDKPELAGPDAMSTSVYGGLGFYGTSAATPAVTGALALLMSARPGLSGAEAAEVLRATAWTTDPIGSPADPALGAGHARLPDPEGAPLGCRRGHIFGSGVLLPILMGLRRRRRGAVGPPPAPDLR